MLNRKSLKLPDKVHIACEALLFAAPALQIDVDCRIIDAFGLHDIAQFQQAAAAFDAGRRCAVAQYCRFGFAVKFVFVGQPCITGAAIVIGFAHSGAYSDAGAVHSVKVVHFARSFATQSHAVAVLVGVHKLGIDIGLRRII